MKRSHSEEQFHPPKKRINDTEDTQLETKHPHPPITCDLDKSLSGTTSEAFKDLSPFIANVGKRTMPTVFEKNQAFLATFIEKYKSVFHQCNEFEKDQLLKKLEDNYIVQVYQHYTPLADDSDKKFNIAYVPKMTSEDQRALKKLNAANGASARKLFTWDMLNLRNKKMLGELQTPEALAKKRTESFKDGKTLELYDMTDRQDYVWLIHTESASAHNLKLVSEHLAQGKLWEKLPFISCSLQDAYTKSYAGSQSIVHSQQAFPISFLLSVDPNTIIDISTRDAKTPEGPDKTSHLRYVQPTLVERIQKDQVLNEVVPTGSVTEIQNPQGGLMSAEQLLKGTYSYNEITVMTGELAKNMGGKPLAIQGIIIDKTQLDEYVKNQSIIIDPKIHDSLIEIINLSQKHDLPCILIDPKPALKHLIQLDAKIINDQIKPDDKRYRSGKYFEKELNHYIQAFTEKATEPGVNASSRSWYGQMAETLKKHRDWVKKPNSLEEEVLLRIIIAEANLDYNFAYLEQCLKSIDELSKMDQKPSRIEELELWFKDSKEISEKQKSTESDLVKYKKELSKHQPNLDFDVKGFSHAKKIKP